MQTKITKIIIAISALFFLQLGLAQNNKLVCYVQVNKASSWSKYTVTLKMLDAMDFSPIATFVLASKTNSKPSVDTAKKSFDCLEHPRFIFKASFTPAIWQNLAGKEYPSKLIWDLSSQVVSPPKDISNITVQVNFPTDFPGVD
jgi:hypothetical protein